MSQVANEAQEREKLGKKFFEDKTLIQGCHQSVEEAALVSEEKRQAGEQRIASLRKKLMHTAMS